MSLADNSQICLKTRQIVAVIISETLKDFKTGSELDLSEALKRKMGERPDIYPSGWYDPPPFGIGVIFENNDNQKRSKFPHLRQEPYWPKNEYRIDKETICMLHLSPVDKDSGIISDIGLSWYKGENQAIQKHLKLCLEAIEDIAEYMEEDMGFGQIHDFGLELFAKNRLRDSLITNSFDPGGLSLGHTIPWTHEKPTSNEEVIIKKGSLDELRPLIAAKRQYINKDVTFKIPETIAFTIEAQLTSETDPNLPNAYFHVIVSFQNGQKKVSSNFNPIFDTLGITYMRSRF